MQVANTRTVIIGGIVVLLGVLFLLQTTGIIPDKALNDSLGSIVVMAIGVMLFIHKPHAWGWALIIFIVGLTDMVENQRWAMFEDHTPWEYIWPIFVILIGVQLMIGRRGRAAKPEEPTAVDK